ncbi:MAG: beta-ketoacyl-ACP reductase [Euryarchaeota archaeon]|nr:beta-ketoacyl-ACP reductase [Euryarchaeota archaeon]
MKFKDKVVVITGSSRGVGKALALGFAREGAHVVVNYVKEAQQAEDVVKEIKSLGQRAVAIKADVADFKQVEQMMQQVLREFKRVDVLVNNAGSFKDSLIKGMEKEVWDEVIATNLNGVFNCTRAVINQMREQKSGKIINITSVQGQTGVIGASNYVAAKAGVIGFTKAAAKEVARSGITVNAVALGFINTGMLKRLPEDLQNKIVVQIPMGRFGEPEEVVKTVCFLASDDANYITGQVINLNGGYYM